MEAARYLLVLSETDPVASALSDQMESAGPIEGRVAGAPIRRMAPEVLVLRRPGPHVRDEHMDDLLPEEIRRRRLPLLFPSIHRSARGTRCFTVHALGNLGPESPLGGRPGWLTPAAPRLMTDALRRLSEIGGPLGLPATFEATHHGPALSCPAFFVEILSGEDARPSAESVSALRRVLLELSEDPRDRIAVGIGGGHYAPHFTGLALERRWSFGHLVSRHALEGATPQSLAAAFSKTPGAEGLLFHRASDGELEAVRRLGPKLSEKDAEPRPGGSEVRSEDVG